MSLKVQLLKCEACETTVYAFPMLPSAYLFPTGELARLRWTFGWCGDCNCVQQVEGLPSVQTLEKEEADLHYLARSKPSGLSRYEQKDLECIGLYRRLLLVRLSWNRCLICGGTSIDPWVFDSDENATHNPHGGCTGQVRQIEDPDGMRIALVDDAETYTLEGEYIGRLAEQPGYEGTENF